jgi:MFS family permease
MPTKSQLESNIWKYKAHVILRNSLMIAAPILPIFMLSRGLTFLQLMTLESIYAAMVVTLEIPTGAFADLLGRKRTLILGSSTFTLALFLLYISTNFQMFLISEIFAAIGASLVSGADSAFLYDTLKKLKQENLYKKIEGSAQSLRLFIWGLGTITVGYLASIALGLPILIAAIINAFGGIILLLGYEPHKLKKVKRMAKHHWNQTLKGIKIATTHLKVRWLIAISAIGGSAGSVSYWFYSPYFELTSLPLVYFGWVFASFHVVASAFSKYAHEIEEKLGQVLSIIVLQSLYAITPVLMGLFLHPLAFFVIFPMQIGRGLHDPIFKQYINDHITSDKRATVLSIKSFSSRMLNIAALPLFGYLADFWSLQTSLLILGITIAAMSAIAFAFKPKTVQ